MTRTYLNWPARDMHPVGEGGRHWTAAQWAEIERLARIARRDYRSGCTPRTAMATLREFAAAAEQHPHGVSVGTIGHVAPPGFGPATDALGVDLPDGAKR